MNEATLARICIRCGIERKHLVLITLFLRAHPEMSLIHAFWEFAHGLGPAAIAAGRAGVRTLPRPPLPCPAMNASTGAPMPQAGESYQPPAATAA